MTAAVVEVVAVEVAEVVRPAGVEAAVVAAEVELEAAGGQAVTSIVIVIVIATATAKRIGRRSLGLALASWACSARFISSPESKDE